ncbi:uncharacterized protein LOC125178248 [Hyalella azteca]|uniref:Uncharacterized protein LOC125178248 n=1 Tax=Hyalella azteca TaxID=294128 RepID=A0A979FLY4_HYAAZ|nr:uncharacterized protein LOC125178248 [Hyalella azteca]
MWLAGSTLFLICSVIPKLHGFQTRVWEIFEMDITLLPPWSVLRTYALSETSCRLLGSSPDLLINLACYKDNECLLVNSNLSLVRSAQTPGWVCLESRVCISSTGVAVTKGFQEADAVCPANFRRVCTSDGMRSLPLASLAHPKATKCQRPFTMTSYGCVFLNLKPYTPCEARRLCLLYGGDLASPATPNDVKALLNYVQTDIGTQYQIWIGLFRWNGNWEYIRNGRDPGTFGQGDWGPDEPDNGPGEFCGRVIFHQGQMIVGDRACTFASQSLCEIHI